MLVLLMIVCALLTGAYGLRVHNDAQARRAEAPTVPTSEAVVAPALPATPVYGTALQMLAREGAAIEAARTSAPTPEEGKMDTRSFERARKYRSMLNRRLAAYLNAHGIAPEGDAWARARRSHVCLFIGTEFIGDWPTLDEAHTALLGLPAESLFEFDVCGDVRLPRNEAELELMRTLASDDGDDRYWPTLDVALADLRSTAILERALVIADTVPTIQPVISSTERMRTLRAAHASAGLTARGTVPLPACGARTKAGTPCKRKAQRVIDARGVGHTIGCDWHSREDITARGITV